MNTKLLRQIRKTILSRPRQFLMGKWFARRTDFNKTPSHCGTACCIAGWAVCLSRKEKPARVSRGLAYDPEGDAREILGLEYGQSARLFYESSWPDKFQQQYEACTNERQQAKVAAARINHLIRTGE